jgi:hypothetical protein
MKNGEHIEGQGAFIPSSLALHPNNPYYRHVAVGDASVHCRDL